MDQDPVAPEKRRLARMLANWSSIIFILPACLVIGLLLGIWLDKKFGAAPWLTIAGFLLGTVAAFYQTFRIINRKE